MRAGVAALDRHLLGNGETVALGMLPIDEANRLLGFAHRELEGQAVAQELVDLLVAVVEPQAGVPRDLDQLGHRAPDHLGTVLAFVVALIGVEEMFELPFDDVVVVAFAEIAQVFVAKLVAEQANDSALGGPLAFADVGHRGAFRRGDGSETRRYFCNRLLGLSGIVNSMRRWARS